ncbi:MAG: hypothetical protein ACT4QF_09635 [Sporichthyaceae bacterium]
MFVHKVTKYDPAHFGANGYEGAEDCLANDPLVEQAYVDSIADFAAAAGVTRLALRDVAFFDGGRIRGVAQAEDDLLAILAGGHLALYNGVEVDIRTALELVRVMLRGSSFWARLEAADRFFVHVGWDMYTYVGTDRLYTDPVDSTRMRGLFPEAIERSPYDPELDEDDHEQRVADTAFWAELADLLSTDGPMLVEEAWVSNSARWHRLTPISMEAVRSALTPRSLLLVWPDLVPVAEFDLDRELLDRIGTLVWLDPDGVLSWLDVGPEDENDPGAKEPDRLGKLTRNAERVWLRSALVEDTNPVLVGVLPDDDGVVRARWLRRTADPRTVAWQSLLDLSAAVGLDDLDLSDEHDRYRLYRTAMAAHVPDTALQQAMVEDPDAVMVASVVMERLDAYDEAQHQPWLAVVHGRSTEDGCIRRSQEIAVARRAARGELDVTDVVRALGAAEWSNMCLDRVSRASDDPRVLAALATEGPTSGIRESAELRHAILVGHPMSTSQLDRLLSQIGLNPSPAEREEFMAVAGGDVDAFTDHLCSRLKTGNAQPRDRRSVRRLVGQAFDRERQRRSNVAPWPPEADRERILGSSPTTPS